MPVLKVRLPRVLVGLIALIMAVPLGIVAAETEPPTGSSDCFTWESDYVSVDYRIDVEGRTWFADVELTTPVSNTTATMRVFPDGDLAQGFQIQYTLLAGETLVVGLKDYVTDAQEALQLHFISDGPVCFSIVYRLASFSPSFVSVPDHVDLPDQAGPKCDRLKKPEKNPLCVIS